MKVWLQMRRQCAGMPLCQLEFSWLGRPCGNVNSWRLENEVTCGIKAIALRHWVYLKASWPWCSGQLKSLQEIPSGLCRFFLLLAPGWRLKALWHRLLSSTCRGCIPSETSVTVCRAWFKSMRDKLLALKCSCSSQPRLPKPQIPITVSSQPKCRGLPHTAWGLITKGGKTRIGYWLSFLGEC